MIKQLIVLAFIVFSASANGQMFAQMFCNRESARLPAEYQEVEYLQSSGTQYIDTGLSIIGRRWELKTAALSSANPYQGSRQPVDATYDNCYVHGSESVVNLVFARITTSYGGSILSTNIVVFSDVSGVSLNGSAFTSISGTRPSINLFLCALNRTPSSTVYAPVKNFYSKIWTTAGVLVQDYVPAYRKSDSVAGMYDLVNATFTTNAGTGSFIAGPTVVVSP